jgi:hypothetical protein
MTAGFAAAHIRMRNQWMDEQGAQNLQEVRDILFYNIPGLERIVDFIIDLTPAPGLEQVRFGPTKEGGFLAVRVATTMDGDRGGLIENALGGRTERECWSVRAPWCDYSGLVGGKSVGMTIFDHPTNWGFPCHWHVRDYGLMAANPLIFEDRSPAMTLLKGEHAVFRYRLYVHAGNAHQAEVAKHYRDFAAPAELKSLNF